MSISFGTGQRLFFFLILGATTLFFLWVVQDYLFPVFWAIVFALLLHPLYLALKKRIGHETLTALLVILGALLLVVIPISWLGTQIAQESFDFYRAVAASSASGSFALPDGLDDVLATFGTDAATLQTQFISWAKTASAWVLAEALGISAATFGAILKTLVMLYLLFFFLRDGEKIGVYVMHRLPLGDRKERALFERFASTTRAIMKGTVLSAFAQGLAGGLIFAFVGIENPVLWGAVMAFLSIIPAVGPSLVWIPAALYLFAVGSFIPALLVLIGGSVVISPLDNVLKPILVGRHTNMPDAFILISILGGIGTFGLAGVVIGPVIAALVLAVWDIFAKEYEAELSAQG